MSNKVNFILMIVQIILLVIILILSIIKYNNYIIKSNMVGILK